MARTPSPPEPPRCPPGWITGPPDFVGVGAHRAGTTRWFELIATHPQVSAAVTVPRPSGRPRPRKEVHFFDSYSEADFSAADVERYHLSFPRPPGCVTGEWTPRYMFDVWFARMLAQAAPDAKILVSLRDPVDRYLSGWGTFLRKTGKRGYAVSADARSARMRWQAQLEQLARSQYFGQVQRLLRHFDRSQVLMLQYEKCRDEPLAELRRTFAFLELEPADFTPAEAQIHAERHPSPNRPEVDPDVHEDLVATFSADVRALATEFPEIEVERWPNFRHLAA